MNHEAEPDSVESGPPPSLSDLQRDPMLLKTLPMAIILELRRQIGHLAVDLDAALDQLKARSTNEGMRPDIRPDRLLTPETAAARFGVTKRWLLSHANEIAGVRRLSRKTIRFSERRLARFLDKPVV